MTTSPYSVREALLMFVRETASHARDYAACPHLREEGVHEGIKVRYSLDIALFERG